MNKDNPSAKIVAQENGVLNQRLYPKSCANCVAKASTTMKQEARPNRIAKTAPKANTTTKKDNRLQYTPGATNVEWASTTVKLEKPFVNLVASVNLVTSWDKLLLQLANPVLRECTTMALQPAKNVRLANGRPSLKLPRTPNAMAIVRLENIPTSLACPVTVNVNCARAGIMAQRQVPPSAWRTQMAPTARKSVQLLRLRPPNAPLARTAHAMVLHRVNIVLWVLMEPRKVWLV